MKNETALVQKQPESKFVSQNSVKFADVNSHTLTQ